MMRRSKDDGTISVLAVGAILAVIVSATLAVDLGRITFTSRDQQGATDRAALDAVRALTDLWNVATTNYTPPDPYNPAARAQDLAQSSLGVNTGAEGHTSSVRVSDVDVGRYDCQANTFYVWDGTFTPATLPTHVRVETTSTVDTLFVGSSTVTGSNQIIKEAIAVAGNVGTISVGSGVANIDSNDAEILNGVFGELVGVNLSVADYQGLVDANVTVAGLLDELNITAGSPNAVLDSATFTMGDFLDASAQALNNQGDAASVTAATILASMATDVTAGASVTISDFLDVTTQQTGNVAQATVNVFDMVTAAITANDGTNTASVSGLNITIPGITNTDMDTTVIEPAQSSTGPGLVDCANNGWVTTASSSQLRVDLTSTLEAETLSILGVPAALTANITVPLHFEAGRAQASITSLYCNQDGRGGTTLTNTQGATMWLGAATVGVAAQVATVTSLGIPVAEIYLFADEVDIAPDSFEGEHELPSSPTVSGGGATIDLRGMLDNGKYTASVVLVGTLDLTDGQQNEIINEVVAAMRDALDGIDTEILGPLTDVAGLTLGHADTTLESVDCTWDRVLVK